MRTPDPRRGNEPQLHELPEIAADRCADIIRGDVLIKAGITGLRKAAAMAELFGSTSRSTASDTPLLDVANLHVALSIENCEFSEGHDPLYSAGSAG